MLLRTSRSVVWKAVGLTAASVQAYRRSRRSQEGCPGHRERTDRDKGGKTALGFLEPSSREEPTSPVRIPLPITSPTGRANTPGSLLAGENRRERRTDLWGPLTQGRHLEANLWDIARILRCQGYWERFLKYASTSSASSSASDEAGGSRGGGGMPTTTEGGAAPPAETPGQGGTGPPDGNQGKGGRGGGAPPPGGGGGGEGWVHPDLPEYAPVCCSCSRAGVEALAHRGTIVTDTLATRRVAPGDERQIAICIAPNARGVLRGHDRTRRCGHTPCPRCTVRVEDQYMCACCATRVQARGSDLRGAGRLPPALAPKGNGKARVRPRFPLPPMQRNCQSRTA